MASSIQPTSISPTSIPPPTAITWVQRLGVFLLRAIMAIFKLSLRFRSTPPAPGPATTHRYGEHPDQTLQFIPRKPGSVERAPVVYIHGGGCYLVAGTEDQLCESTKLFAERLEGSSSEVMLEIFEGEQHGFFNLSWRPASQEMRGQVSEFLKRHDSSGAADEYSGGY